MSKPAVRILFSVLIALVLVAGAYTSVHGLPLFAGTTAMQAGARAEFSFNSTFNQSPVQSPGAYGVQPYPHGRSEHDCGSEADYDPADD